MFDYSLCEVYRLRFTTDDMKSHIALGFSGHLNLILYFKAKLGSHKSFYPDQALEVVK